MKGRVSSSFQDGYVWAEPTQLTQTHQALNAAHDPNIQTDEHQIKAGFVGLNFKKTPGRLFKSVEKLHNITQSK